MHKYLAYFTVEYVDIDGDTNMCEGAVPYRATDADSYFIAEAVIKGIPGARYLYSELVP